ncbi:MAG: hypothetical protein IJB74_05315 [Clostridia bacterium]|nr:hypothetical protein [Clostridia bacterium]
MDNSELFDKENTTANAGKSSKGKVLFSLLIGAFCFIIFAGGITLFTGEDREFSESENRVLAPAPDFSFYAVKDGSFMKAFETYFTDQFIFRDEIIRLKTFADRLTGKTEVGGVYIGEEGYLFSVPAPFDEKKQEIMKKISAFAESNKDSKVTFMLSPNSSHIYKDKLPAHLTLEDQKAQTEKLQKYTESKKVNFINLYDAFSAQKDEIQLFYKTDHHWTTDAAYIAFSELMKSWKKSTAGVKFNFLPVADDFQGTLSSKSGVNSSGDIIEICVPQNSALTYVVDYEDGEKKTASLFDGSKLQQKNKYEVFAGGNYGKITIRTTSSEKDTLLMVKDSYANCMLPMLTPFFAKIVVIDPRYTKEKLSAVIEENDFSHILFLYNMDTFLGDTSLEGFIA